MEVSRRCSHSGEGPFVTPRITRPAKSGQAGSVSAAMETGIGFAKAPGTFSTVSGRSVPSPRAARSRATPRTPSASGRLGVILIWIIGSMAAGRFSASQCTKVSPTSPEGSSMMPLCSSDSSSSRSEAIMPWLSTPRILPTPSVTSSPGT